LNRKYAINVYAIENGKEIYTLRVSKLIPPDEGCYINLLPHENHYSLVNNFGTLINSQMSNHKGTRFHCYRCLNSFTNENALKDHTEYCKTHAPVKTIFADKPVKFTNYNRSMRVPFVIYAYFETFNKKIDTCEPTPGHSYTQKIMKQVPSSFCFYLVSTATGASLA
jgi:hypothetical protein